MYIISSQFCLSDYFVWNLYCEDGKYLGMFLVPTNGRSHFNIGIANGSNNRYTGTDNGASKNSFGQVIIQVYCVASNREGGYPLIVLLR